MRISSSFLLCGALLTALSTTTLAARRPGASRALRLDWPATATQTLMPQALRGVVRADKNGPTLIFTRDADGTRNIWQATPTADKADWTRIASESPAWQVAPITTFAAPLWADEPVLSAGGRVLFCITNALGMAAGGEYSQIARYDWRTRKLTALTGERAQHRSLSLSPDGTKLSFVREVRGVESVFIMPSAGGAAWKVLDGARHPAWLDDTTLLLSGSRTGLNGLYRVALPDQLYSLRPDNVKPTLLYPRGGQVAVAPDGTQLCLAPDEKDGAESRLVLLAADGSGARAISGTEGARAPHYAPDGEALIFDAPVQGVRSLWLLPLVKAAPTVQLLAARALPVTNVATAAPQSIEIIGTVFSPEMDAPQVRLEVGQGVAPQRWETLPTPLPPINASRLALWNPPLGARGEWTLRLTASGADGEASQSTLTVTLPLSPDSAASVPDIHAPSQTSIKLTPPGFGNLHTAPPRTEVTTEEAKIRTLPGGQKVFPEVPRTTPATAAEPLATPGAAPLIAKTSPDTTPSLGVAPLPTPPASSNQTVIATRPTPVATGEPKAPENTVPVRASLSGTLPSAPLPPLPPPPTMVPAVAPLSGILDDAPVRHGIPLPAMHTAPKPTAVPPSRTAPPRPPVTALPPVRRNAAPPPAPSSAASARATSARETPRAAASTKSSAQIIVRAVPARMKADESVPVNVSLRNTSVRAWETTGSAPVRLLVRWHDVGSGMRSQYRIEWLRMSVPPGGGALMNIALKAPSRAARYRVSFTLVRLPNGQYQPPPANSGTASSGADELAESTFIVTVE